MHTVRPRTCPGIGKRSSSRTLAFTPNCEGIEVSRTTVIAIFATAVAIAGVSPARAAESTVYSVDQLRNALYAASPGDRIYVAPGTYTSRLYVDGVHGTADNMIEVVALDPNNRPKFTSNSAACFTLTRCSYILVDGIEAYGGGTPTQGSNNIEFPYGSHMSAIDQMISRNSLMMRNTIT